MVTGTTISSTTHNNTMSDIATALTDSIDKDGQTVITGALDFNGNEIILDVDGDTSITSDTDDQIDIKVAGVDDFQITANKFDVLAGSVLKGTGQIEFSKGADVASASNLLVNIDGNMFDVTGTTTINTIAARGIGSFIVLQFDDILTLTHSADLVLPGASNILTEAGDVGVFYEYAAGDYRLVSLTSLGGGLTNVVEDTTPQLGGNLDGQGNDLTKMGTISMTEQAAANADVAGDGQIWVENTTPNRLMFTDDTGNDIVVADSAEQRVVQVVNVQDGTVASGTTAIPLDNTIPQNTEGDQFLSLAITPKSASNILKIEVSVWYARSAVGHVSTALFQDSTVNALDARSQYIQAGNVQYMTEFSYYMVTGTTSTTTFKVRIGGNGAGTTTLNGVSGSTQYFGGVGISSITITEYTP